LPLGACVRASRVLASGLVLRARVAHPVVLSDRHEGEPESPLVTHRCSNTSDSDGFGFERRYRRRRGRLEVAATTTTTAAATAGGSGLNVSYEVKKEEEFDS
jgi:hypothetical protein